MVARLRVSTSGTGAVSDDYANGVATAGTALLSGGAGAPPTWGSPAQANIPVAQTVFVDGVNGSATGTGNFGSPLQTIQQAVNRAVANGWTAVQIIAAPGTYAGAIAIPLALEIIVIHGWGPPDFGFGTIIGGNITATSLAGGWTNLILSNLVVTAATIETANPLVEDLTLTLSEVFCTAAITAANLTLNLIDTSHSGNATANGGLIANFDGWSWNRHLLFAPAYTAGGIYTRALSDAGHGTYLANVAAAAVPVFPAAGSTAFVAVAVPAFVRADDVAQVQVMDPAVQDFICAVHGVNAGSVVVALTNLSRAGGNFNESVKFTFHHETMAPE